MSTMTASPSSAVIAAQDRVLVDAFKGGDAEAFDMLMKRHYNTAYSLAMQLLRNHEDAEEVAQDAFIRARRGLCKFRGDSAFKTWLHQIVTNLSRNRYWFWFRRKRALWVGLDARISPYNDTILAETLPSGTPDPGDELEMKEIVSKISACMQMLSARHREILVLHVFKHLSYEELAEILGINVGTVKSRLARARNSLYSELASRGVILHMRARPSR